MNKFEMKMFKPDMRALNIIGLVVEEVGCGYTCYICYKIQNRLLTVRTGWLKLDDSGRKTSYEVKVTAIWQTVTVYSNMAKELLFKEGEGDPNEWELEKIMSIKARCISTAGDLLMIGYLNKEENEYLELIEGVIEGSYKVGNYNKLSIYDTFLKTINADLPSVKEFLENK